MEIMKPFRQRIDALDDQIIDLLIARSAIIREVGHFKFENDIPAVLPDRIAEVRERRQRDWMLIWCASYIRPSLAIAAIWKKRSKRNSLKRKEQRTVNAYFISPR